MSDVPFHAIADCWPLIEGDDFSKLVEDVGAHGLIEPITLYEGAILDGRNRYRACQIAGVPTRFVIYDGSDPVAFAKSKNDARRHLNASQRAMVASWLATLRQGARTDLRQNCEKSLADAAERMHVSRRQATHARTVQRHGSPELVKKVEQGAISVANAAEIARLPIEQQREIAALPARQIIAETAALRTARWDGAQAENGAAEHPAADRARPSKAEGVEAQHEAPEQASGERDAAMTAVCLVADLIALPSLDRVSAPDARAAAAKLLAHADAIDPPAAALPAIVEPRPLFALEPVSPLSRAPTAPRAGKAEAAAIEREFARDFWPQVPKKVGRAEALKAFTRARKDTPLADIVAGILRYAASREGEDHQFTKSPTAWLNGRRWEDETPPAQSRPSREMTATERVLAGIDAFDAFHGAGE